MAIPLQFKILIINSFTEFFYILVSNLPGKDRNFLDCYKARRFRPGGGGGGGS